MKLKSEVKEISERRIVTSYCYFSCYASPNKLFCRISQRGSPGSDCGLNIKLFLNSFLHIYVINFSYNPHKFLVVHYKPFLELP